MPRRRQGQDDWPPLTVTRRALLVGGSDRKFRRLVEDMVQFAARLQTIREGLAARMSLTPPQFKIVMALAHAQVPAMTATGLSAQFRVSMPFIVTETAKLEHLGLVRRRRNPDDARSLLIELTPAGKRRVRGAGPFMAEVNDLLFAPLSRAAMRQLGAITERLLASSQDAMAVLDGARPAAAIGGRERR